MLYIVTTDGHEIEWHVGEPVPKMWGLVPYGTDRDLQRISYIQADGDELAHIREMFTSGFGSDGCPRYNIPMPAKQMCHWYGDLAKTIYLNL